MSVTLPMKGPVIDRRGFLGASLAVASMPAAALIPETSVDAAAKTVELQSDWTIDDQWMGYPRYSDPHIPGRPEAARLPRVDPADEIFVVF